MRCSSFHPPAARAAPRAAAPSSRRRAAAAKAPAAAAAAAARAAGPAALAAALLLPAAPALALFDTYGSVNPLENPFTPVATVGLSLLTGMSLLGQSKANASKERLEAMGIQTDGVREVKFVRGQELMLESGKLTKEEVQENFKAEARKIALWLGKEVPEYAQED